MKYKALLLAGIASLYSVGTVAGERAPYEWVSYNNALYDRLPYEVARYERAYYEQPSYGRPSYERASYDVAQYDRYPYENARYENGWNGPVSYGNAQYDDVPRKNDQYAIAPYIGIKAGVAWERTKVKDGNVEDKETSVAKFVGSAGVGLTLKSKMGALRAELEYTYHPEYKADYQIPGVTDKADAKLKVKQDTFMLNVYYEIPMDLYVSPYLGAGIGLNHVSISSDGTFKGGKKVDDTKNLFAWNVTGGVTHNITRNLALDLGYRYMSTSDYEENDVKVSLYDHQVYVGLRYTFF